MYKERQLLSRAVGTPGSDRGDTSPDWGGPPKWPLLKPSESCQNSYSRAEGLVAGSSESAASPTAAPTQETPAEEPPMAEAPIPGPSHSSPPALMETGGVGDGQSWADRAEASAEAEFRQV